MNGVLVRVLSVSDKGFPYHVTRLIQNYVFLFVFFILMTKHSC